MDKGKFYDYLQVFVSLAIVGVWAYLQVTGRAVSPEVYGFLGAIVGFFFRGVSEKSVKAIQTVIKKNSLKGDNHD